MAAWHTQVHSDGSPQPQVCELKSRRQLEHKATFEEMVEKRRIGYRQKVSDPYALARTRDVAAAHWATMDAHERTAAKSSAEASRKAAAAPRARGQSADSKQRQRNEAVRAESVLPKGKHGGSLAMSRGEEVSASSVPSAKSPSGSPSKKKSKK